MDTTLPSFIHTIQKAHFALMVLTLISVHQSHLHDICGCLPHHANMHPMVFVTQDPHHSPRTQWTVHHQEVVHILHHRETGGVCSKVCWPWWQLTCTDSCSILNSDRITPARLFIHVQAIVDNALLLLGTHFQWSSYPKDFVQHSESYPGALLEACW